MSICKALLISLMMILPVFVTAQKEPAVSRKQVAAWEQLKYGMFIHFNMNTYAGAEYDNGKVKAESFNPVELDVDQWIRTARDAGMKYAVLTAKHTGGFCLWDSKVEWKGKEYDYDIASSGCKKDIVAGFIESCRKYHISPALYYCLLDDHNQSISTKDEYFRLAKAHITELVTNYKGLVELWIDIPSVLQTSQRIELYAIVKSIQPECLITCNNGFTDGSLLANFPADITNGERTLPPPSGHNPDITVNGKKYYIPMEVCQTINQNWFWIAGDVIKSVRTLYYWYNETNKRGASFLLDVPPDISGRIPQNMVNRLTELKRVIDNKDKLPALKTLTGYKPVKASGFYDNRAEYLPEYAVDEDPNTRWVAMLTDTMPTLTVDLGAIIKFNTVVLMEPYNAHIEEFEIQCLKDNTWKTILRGTGIGTEFTRQFPAVESRMVRLVITRFKTGENPYNVLSFPGKPSPDEGATIAEFQIINTDPAAHSAAQKNRIIKLRSASEKSFPESMECVVQLFYRHRPDGKPGREITLNFKGPKFSGKGAIEVQCSGEKEIIPLNTADSIDHFSVLLPYGSGVASGCEATIIFRSAGHELLSSVRVTAKRHWTVYIYPHSHVDIGYTNTQKNVEIIHKRNLINGIELAKKTAHFPDGSRYLWNPEVLWPVERYLTTASPQQRQEIIEAVRKGYLHLDAGYIHTNTSSSADEELFEFFHQSKVMEELTGTKIETLVQVDVPGMSWGIVPVASNLGIKYCLALNNGSDRVGLSTELSFRPFWWLGQDGKSRILFLQPGSYNPGAIAKGFAYWPLMAGQTDTSKLIQIVKTDNPREHFLDKYLNEKLPELEKSDYYPYDIFAMSWAMADNTPIDADLPDAVKSWNEEYAFPHLIIASATEIMQTFEKKYGDQLPVLSGDFTEYWTDGLGTAAKQTGMNRSSKERLIQAEVLWTMLHPGEPAPRSEFEEAWRNVIMGTEHTWCYMDPEKQPITNEILNVKFGFFQKAEDQSKVLLKSALSAVTDSGSSVLMVFNTLSWSRSGLVYLSLDQSNMFYNICDEKGKTLISQRLSTGELVFLASDIPAFGSKKYFLKKNKSNSGGSIAIANILDNGILHLMIDTVTGEISGLTCGNHEFVDSKAKCLVNSYRYLHVDDSPEKATGTKDVKISVKENGPLMGTLLIESKAEGCNSLSREITLVAGQQEVEIKNIIDKQAILEKEGIHFGFAFNISEPVTWVDIPWGIMELEKDQLSGANRNWIAFQRWLDISNNDRGVTLCSLDAPVFESGDLTANILGAATGSPKWIRKLMPGATIYSWALNNHWHTNFPLSQEGKIQFRYRLFPHNSKYDPASADRFGREQVQPLIAARVKNNVQIKPSLALSGSKSVFVSMLKTDNEGKTTQLRLRSLSGKNELVKFDWTDRKPLSLIVEDSIGRQIRKEITEEVLVPGMGLVTLDVVW